MGRNDKRKKAKAAEEDKLKEEADKKANEDKWFHGISTFMSQFTSPNDIEEDKQARSYLSQTAYENLWLPAKRLSCQMSVSHSEEGIVVKEIDDETNESSVIIPHYGRCPCWKRIAFLYQCLHEYRVDGKLILHKYDDNKWKKPSVYHKNVTHCWPCITR